MIGSKHVDFWRESGASDFAVSVILNGYVPQMQRNPEKYQEKNNKSYRDEMAWANEAVRKLQRAKVVVEIRKESLLITLYGKLNTQSNNLSINNRHFWCLQSFI